MNKISPIFFFICMMLITCEESIKNKELNLLSEILKENKIALGKNQEIFYVNDFACDMCSQAIKSHLKTLKKENKFLIFNSKSKKIKFEQLEYSNLLPKQNLFLVSDDRLRDCIFQITKDTKGGYKLIIRNNQVVQIDILK